MSSTYPISGSFSGSRRRGDDYYERSSKEKVQRYEPYSSSWKEKSEVQRSGLSQKWERGVSLDDDERAGYRSFLDRGVKPVKDGFIQLLEEEYLEKIKNEKNVAKLKIIWKEWKKDPYYHDSALVESYYINQLASLRAYDLVLAEWERIPMDSPRLKEVRLFNSYVASIKHTNIVTIDQKMLDRIHRASSNSFANYQDSPLFKIYQTFNELHATRQADIYTYQIYLDLAKLNGSYEETFRAYVAAKNLSKTDPITEMIYVDCLVAQRKLEEAEAEVKKSLVGKQNPNGMVEIDLHDLSHGVGYILVRKFIKSKQAPHQFYVIHGIGQEEDRNYLAFKKFLKEKFSIDPLISSEWSWEDHPRNLGIICLKKKEAESFSSENKFSFAEAEKPKQPQFRSVEDLIFALRNKPSQKN